MNGKNTCLYLNLLCVRAFNPWVREFQWGNMCVSAACKNDCLSSGFADCTDSLREVGKSRGIVTWKPEQVEDSFSPCDICSLGNGKAAE